MVVVNDPPLVAPGGLERRRPAFEVSRPLENLERVLQDLGCAGLQGFADRLEEEVGDMFFVLVNIARYLSLDPESALKKTNRKFKRRFQWMEDQLRQNGRTPQQAAADELEALWQQAKQQEHEPQPTIHDS